MDRTSTSGMPHQMVGGRYSFDPAEILGSGGLGIVYRGRDLRTRQPVAVKALRSEHLRDPEHRRRFREEARMMRFAHHPRLVQIHDHIDQDNGSWIVMELVPGRNLKSTLADDGPLSITDTVRIVREIAAALDFLHQRDAVHLDIKPQNIVLTPDDGARLIDFGLAQAHGPRQETIQGNAFGTPAYMSPEQAKGGAVDRRSDVYALGCVVFEMLAGRPPFVAPEGPDNQQAIITKQIQTVPAAPSTYRPELPEWLDSVVLRAIAKSPLQRYQSAGAFARALVDGLGQGAAHPTSEMPAAGATEAGFDHGEDMEAAGPSVVRQAWVAGGRVARRTRRFRGTIWRLAMVFAIGNALLGLVMLTRDGPDAILGPILSITPGTSTVVSTDRLNLRDEPGEASNVVAVLETGAEVQITGASRVRDGDRWWPVDVAYQGGTLEGWVWDGGIASTWFIDVTSLPSRSWQGLKSWVDDARDWLPVGNVATYHHRPLEGTFTVSQ